MIRSIVVFIFFINGFSCFSQTYYPFPKDSATWSDVWVSFYINPGPKHVECQTVHFGLHGDTLIDNNIYSKLYQSDIWTDTSFNYINSDYHMGIREDSSRKVWMRWPSDTIDLLFYDFGLNVGDTFYYWRKGPMEVLEIDSILIDGDYRRVTKFYPKFSIDTLTMIEGIGFKRGLMGPSGQTDGFEFLECAKQKGHKLYEIQFNFYECKCYSCHCSSETTSIELIKGHSTRLNVFPNPVTHLLSIQLDCKFDLTSVVEVYSITGQKVFSAQINGNNNSVNVASLEQGLYTVRVENSEGLFYSRFLKTRP